MAQLKDLVIETGARWLAVMEYLEAKGAMRPEGFRHRQDAFAEDVAIPRRSLSDYLHRMEELKVIHVQRTTIDGTFGAPRGPNIYRLLVSPADWPERAEHIAREKIAQHKATLSRATKSHRAAERRARAGDRPAAGSAVVPIPDDVLDAVADELDDNDDLFGW